MYNQPYHAVFKFMVKILFPDIHNHFKDRFLGDNIGLIDITWDEEDIGDSLLNISILTHNGTALN